MIQIVPTITAYTPADFATELSRLNFASRLHIDIADGDFAPSRTVNLNQIYWDNFRENPTNNHSKQSEKSSRIIDLHLMLRDPLNWLHQIISLNPSLAIFHAEINEPRQNLPKIREHLAKFQIKFGVAILPETHVENIREIIEIADHVLIFAGHLGFQGGAADLAQLAKVAEIRAIWQEINEKACENSTQREKSQPADFSERGRIFFRESKVIAWDGGANAENIREIAKSGVDVINVGSAISKSENPEKEYQKLLNEVENV